MAKPRSGLSVKFTDHGEKNSQIHKKCLIKDSSFECSLMKGSPKKWTAQQCIPYLSCEIIIQIFCENLSENCIWSSICYRMTYSSTVVLINYGDGMQRKQKKRRSHHISCLAHWAFRWFACSFSCRRKRGGVAKTCPLPPNDPPEMFLRFFDFSWGYHTARHTRRKRKLKMKTFLVF